MIVLLPVLAYLIGSIPSGLIIGKFFYHIDIREHGSGNLGATNTFRTLGTKAGVIVTILDLLKGTIATLLPIFFGYDTIHPIYLGILAVMGHIWPVFAGFRGGKAVATSAGIILAYSPLLFVLLAIVFFASLKISKYVSLASMICGVVAFIYSLVYFFAFERDWHFVVLMGAICAFILVKHRANMLRIKTKTEPKVSWI